MAVGIIAYQIAVIQPDDSLELEESLQQMVDAVSVPAERKEELAKYAQKMMKRQY